MVATRHPVEERDLHVDRGDLREAERKCPLMSLNPFVGRQVHTEFIYSEIGPSNGVPVSLCGDWNQWEPLEMVKDPTHPKVWSLITLVPAGYHEFCFLVDSDHRVSSGHPLTADESCNWRYVKGPPRRDRATRYGPMSKFGFLGYINELLCRVTEGETNDPENLETQMIRFRRQQLIVITLLVIGIICITAVTYIYLLLRADRSNALEAFKDSDW